MSRVASIVLVLALAGFLPANASAEVPRVGQSEMASLERAQLRRAITQIRAMLAQLKDPRACFPPQEVRTAERLLEDREWA